MALTLEEKRINRARRAFEADPTRFDLFTEWWTLRQAFLLTPSGAIMFRLEAMEFLRNARFVPPTPRYVDGYAAAVAFLRYAAFLDYIVSVVCPEREPSPQEA